VNSVVGIASLVVTARYLDLEVFGFFVLAQTYVLIFGLIINFQTWQPVAKFASQGVVSNEAQSVRKIMSFALLVDALCAFLLGGLALLLVVFASHRWGLDIEQKLTIAAFLLVVISNISGAFSGLLRLLNKTSEVARVQVYFGVIRLFLVVAAALSGGGVVVFAVAWAVSEVLSHLMLVSSGMRAYAERFGSRFFLDFSHFNARKQMFGFMVSNLCQTKTADVQKLLLSRPGSGLRLAQ